MAVGEDKLPSLAPVAGVRLATVSAGIKTPARPDLVLFELEAGTTVASMFTRNAFCAAPVHLARQHLKEKPPRYFIVNTGNANAGTGQQGIADARRCCTELADLAGVSAEEVLPFSTGVIGEHLPMGLISKAIPELLPVLSAKGWEDAANGILTTDTRPKGASRRVSLAGGEVTITGIAKGAGMIRPDMATMLSYVATDAKVSTERLQALVAQAVNRSFNRITVDGDTSTNDAVMLVASGSSGLVPEDSDADWQTFSEAVIEVFVALAQAIVRDGEGASKFVTVEVTGGADSRECLKVAYAVAESPLVKTAVFASDANWGRILAAVGRSGLAELDADGVKISLNGVLIAERGGRANSYTEQQGEAAMAVENIHILVELARGSARETVWTTDLSHEYITINAEYRT